MDGELTPWAGKLGLRRWSDIQENLACRRLGELAGCRIFSALPRCSHSYCGYEGCLVHAALHRRETPGYHTFPRRVWSRLDRAPFGEKAGVFPGRHNIRSAVDSARQVVPPLALTGPKGDGMASRGIMYPEHRSLLALQTRSTRSGRCWTPKPARPHGRAWLRLHLIRGWRSFSQPAIGGCKFSSVERVARNRIIVFA
ncbi:uncharacterized protein LY79DRAFT_222145 [Colletotrichum navitas]|uniref:Uncharacterized protein n=1 Tax=Colletotrichum navitas TaxID=681940 RepID=A0AAD8Q088_9PEZI|nr:uncharacterized protein LY79DRAFT_222145 [Colletotrichum navitas]KAK1590352.1 hypothetical protein LY79DRAFT_222145 [Colletotrichum navitas]